MTNHHPRLRPPAFVLTGGRTQPSVEVEATAVVQARSDAALPNSDSGGVNHCWALWNFCQEPQSIADVAKHFDLPLQVAKILVADLIVAQQLEVGAKPDERGDLALLQKVLKALSAS